MRFCSPARPPILSFAGTHVRCRCNDRAHQQGSRGSQRRCTRPCQRRLHPAARPPNRRSRRLQARLATSRAAAEHTALQQTSPRRNGGERAKVHGELSAGSTAHAEKDLPTQHLHKRSKFIPPSCSSITEIASVTRNRARKSQPEAVLAQSQRGASAVRRRDLFLLLVHEHAGECGNEKESACRPPHGGRRAATHSDFEAKIG